MIKYPTTHKDKLIAAINNKKVPLSEKKSLKTAFKFYKKWISKIENCYNIKNILLNRKIDILVDELNKYKNYIDIDLIFDSKNNFLYRQKGQMKLSSSVVEEVFSKFIFLPYLLGSFF